MADGDGIEREKPAGDVEHVDEEPAAIEAASDDAFDSDEGADDEGADDEGADDEEPSEDDGTLGLDFDRAELEAQATACTRCKAWVANEYYQADGLLVCTGCARTLRYGEKGDSGPKRAARAFALGSAAAAVSGLVWWGIREVTGYEIGLIAIAVGLAVGFAVKAGAGGLGGWFYQLAAVALTYLAIVSTYVPEILHELEHPVAEVQAAGDAVTMPAEPITGPVAFVFACIVALFAPIFMGLENIIGIAIIAFALWEAWRVNRRPVKSILGPYALASIEPPP